MRTVENKNEHRGIDIFDSLIEFVKYTDGDVLNKAFTGKGQASRYVSKKFSGTDSWEQASHLMIGGYPEGMKAMLECKGGIVVDNNFSVAHDKVDYMGYRPNVPRAIMGLPKAMMRRYREQPQSKTIHIVYDCTASYDISSDYLARAGKNLMAFIKYNEQRVFVSRLICSVEQV